MSQMTKTFLFNYLTKEEKKYPLTTVWSSMYL